MSIVPAQSALTAEDSAVTLARYAAIVGYPECAFWGVARDGDRAGACREIWSKAQRDDVARYLAEAQEEIEAEIGFFLAPRYVVGTLSAQPRYLDRYVDAQDYRNCHLRARWPKVIEPGVRAAAMVGAGAVVDHSADPAVIGPLATTVTDVTQIHVYHPGSELEINPSAVTLAGGNVTIAIPRCRLVKEALADNPPEGLEYADDMNFEATVDVVRVYTDPGTQAELVSRHACGDGCLAGNCSDQAQTACIYVRDGRLGHLEVAAAVYADGAWRPGGACRHPFRVRLNYLAGTRTLTRQAEDTIVRLAHAKLPNEPCGCELAQRLWRRDRFTPEILSRERLNCPFGTSEGSWTAFKFAMAMKQFVGSVL